MKRAIPILLVVVAVAAAWFYYSRHRPQPSPAEMKLSGNVEAHESLVGFKVSGRIVELPVEEGQSVSAGQLIARLDSEDYRRQLALDNASEHVRGEQLQLALAGSRKQEIQAAHDQVVDAQADLAQKSKDYERFEALFKKDEVTAQARDQAETNMLRARATLERLQQVYNQTQEGTRKEQIAVDRANLHQARNAVRLSQVKLDYTELAAPLAGVVLVRQAELGEVVSPGSPVVTIADLDHLWVRVYLPETELGKVHLGDQVSIATDTYPGKHYTGRVAFISSEAEFTPKSVQTEKERVTLVYRVKVDVDNTQHELKPGMPADVFVPVK